MSTRATSTLVELTGEPDWSTETEPDERAEIAALYSRRIPAARVPQFEGEDNAA
jgi:hypothetical protein